VLARAVELLLPAVLVPRVVPPDLIPAGHGQLGRQGHQGSPHDQVRLLPSATAANELVGQRLPASLSRLARPADEVKLTVGAQAVVAVRPHVRARQAATVQSADRGLRVAVRLAGRVRLAAVRQVGRARLTVGAQAVVAVRPHVRARQAATVQSADRGLRVAVRLAGRVRLAAVRQVGRARQAGVAQPTERALAGPAVRPAGQARLALAVRLAGRVRLAAVRQVGRARQAGVAQPTERALAGAAVRLTGRVQAGAAVRPAGQARLALAVRLAGQARLALAVRLAGLVRLAAARRTTVVEARWPNAPRLAGAAGQRMTGKAGRDGPLAEVLHLAPATGARGNPAGRRVRAEVRATPA
jgi:hypothetical protein